MIPKDVTKDPSRLVALLHAYEVERLMLVPTLLKSILTYLSLVHDSSLLQNLKTWISSGETLSVSLANEFFDYFTENNHVLCNFYGSTEYNDTTHFICERKEHLRSLRKMPIGYPLFNTAVYVLDSDRIPMDIGESGELYVAGLNMADGYVNGRDKDRFIENPFTPDLSKYI